MKTDLRTALAGITATVVTPFDPDTLDVDEAALRANLRVLAGSGVAAVVPAGNTGEFHSLTADEVRQIAVATAEEIGGKKAVLVGVGGDLRTAVALAQHAERAGADGVLLHEPAHTFASEEGLAAYYRAVCGAVGIGVAIYKRTPRLPDRLLLELAEACPNVVAIKYAWNDVAAYAELVARAPEGVVCACGSAERWALPFAAAGTTGFTSGVANFAPEASLRLWEALRAGDRSRETLALWDAFARIERLRARDGGALNVPAIKCAMDLAGLRGGAVRPPLSPASPEIASELRALLADLGVAAGRPAPLAPALA